jgi:hypothetical protein
MRKVAVAFFVVTFISSSLLAQKKEEVVLSDAIQVDSSSYFMIPRLLDDENKDAYGKGKGYLPWGNYTNIFFYNAATNQTKKVFDQLCLIRPFYARYSYYYAPKQETEIPTNFLPSHIVYLATTHDFNNDRALDSDDPLYLYISTKTGEGLRQITPQNFNVLSWTVSKDKKMILVRGQNDKNGNKKFGNGDDNLYYRIDLNDDVSKIKCYQINL